MQKTADIAIKDYSYPLPEEKIAKYPLAQRDSSKLLIYKNGEIEESVFYRLPEFLPENSMLIFNNTKVIQARLYFRKETGALIEVFCLDPYAPRDYAEIFQKVGSCSWLCMIGNLKKWKNGSLSRKIIINGKEIVLRAEKGMQIGNAHEVVFSWDDATVTFGCILDAAGELPIPPYLNRETEERDKETYQTVYSKVEGSVAAPTAGLHFTPDVFAALSQAGIPTYELTLHVGAGTFKPVKSDTLSGHEMHTELISVERPIIEALLSSGKKVIAVGTTSVRTLESLYYIGAILEENPDAVLSQLEVDQWLPYSGKNEIPVEKSLQNILTYLDKNKLPRLVTSTRIMIAPGYAYKIVKGIVTNFHQPQSTLLLLISAFIQGHWREIYDYALSHDFRFLSYGDSSLLLPE